MLAAVLRGVMQNYNHTPQPHTVNLVRGGQAVINGAIVTASATCTLEVGSGAFVLTGRSLWRDRDPLQNPHEELYFSLLDASVSKERFTEQHFRLFSLLSQVVSLARTHEAQQECTLCASALIAGNAEDATRSAARLASMRMEALSKERRVPARPKTLPGQPGKSRSSVVDGQQQV